MSRLLGIFCTLLCLVGSAGAETITEANLLENEAFWPYQVRLTRPFEPEGSEKSFKVGTPGVLIRMEESGLARIDFASKGVHDVPVGVTNILLRANEHAERKRHRFGDNFVVAVGPRLTDPDGVIPRPWDLPNAGRYDAFLCVFADESKPEFETLARGAAELVKGRANVETVFFPLGGMSDEQLIDHLSALDWKVPFMLPYMSEAYTESLIDASYGKPAVALNTPGGRVLYQGAWNDEARKQIADVLEKRFGAPKSGQTAEAGSPAEGGAPTTKQ